MIAFACERFLDCVASVTRSDPAGFVLGSTQDSHPGEALWPVSGVRKPWSTWDGTNQANEEDPRRAPQPQLLHALQQVSTAELEAMTNGVA